MAALQSLVGRRSLLSACEGGGCHQQEHISESKSRRVTGEHAEPRRYTRDPPRTGGIKRQMDGFLFERKSGEPREGQGGRKGRESNPEVLYGGRSTMN